jgi:hypothetical protein
MEPGSGARVAAGRLQAPIRPPQQIAVRTRCASSNYLPVLAARVQGSLTRSSIVGAIRERRLAATDRMLHANGASVDDLTGPRVEIIADALTPAQGGGGNNNDGRWRGGGYGNGGDGGDEGHGKDGNRPHRSPVMASWVISGVAVVAALGLYYTPPAAASAGGDADSASGVAAGAGSPGRGVATTASLLSTATIPGDNGGEQSPQQRLKRLMREAFSELTDLRVRLEALEAEGTAAADAAAAGEALVMPLEGFAVRPISRALAPGVRLRCSAQVGATVLREEWAAQ